MSEQGAKADKPFACSYKFDGVSWGLEVWASTHEEAEMKLKAIGRTGKVDGVAAGKMSVGGLCPTCGHDMGDGGEMQ